MTSNSAAPSRSIRESRSRAVDIGLSIKRSVGTVVDEPEDRPPPVFTPELPISVTEVFREFVSRERAFEVASVPATVENAEVIEGSHVSLGFELGAPPRERRLEGYRNAQRRWEALSERLRRGTEALVEETLLFEAHDENSETATAEPRGNETELSV